MTNHEKQRDTAHRLHDSNLSPASIAGSCRTLCGTAADHAAPWLSQARVWAERSLDFVTSHHRDLLRYSLAIVFIWFGMLKPLGISPANALVARTVAWFPAEWFIPFLGLWEVAIGLGLIMRRYISAALVLLFLQMAGTLLPLFTLIDVCYTRFPFGLTLEGQYIIKNLVLISAAISIAIGVAQEAAGATEMPGSGSAPDTDDISLPPTQNTCPTNGADFATSQRSSA